MYLPTFQKKAENAAIFALKIAEKANANIILFHSIENFQSVNVPESGSWMYEDYEVVKNESIAELKKLENYLTKYHKPGAFEPEISLLNDMGYDLGDNVSLLVKNKNIGLVIMGTKSDDTVSHVFSGSDASSVLGHANCPVLFVPENCHFEDFKNIVFANDLKKDYTEAISFLVELARLDNSHIVLTHFGDYTVKAFSCLKLIENELKFDNISSRLLPMEKMDEQLRNFAASAKADLIVLIHHKQDYLKNIVFGSDSKNILKHNQLPVLILPG